MVAVMHRWLPGDVNEPDDVCLSCYACGVHVDATVETGDSALAFVPVCRPGGAGRAHDFLYIGPARGAGPFDLVGGAYLECAQGDCVIRPDTEGATVGPCVGA
jgi:hypothetical protein